MSFNMANKIISDYALAGSIDPVQDLLLLEQFSTNSYKSINRNTLLGVSGQPADLTTTQTFLNKIINNTNTVSLLDSNFTLQDNLDPTKQAQFQLSGITTSTTRTYTLPNASSTLADISTAQTFTNKTLTSPVINSGSISNTAISVDSISEFTAANGVTIDGLNVKDGKLNTVNSVITSNITDSSVTPAKLQTGTGNGWAWQAWTPSFTNLTIGAGGTYIARYTQIGKFVRCYFRFVFGTGSAVGPSPSFTVPVTANSTTYDVTKNNIIGVVEIEDAGVANYTGVTMFAASLTAATPFVTLTGSTYAGFNGLGATIPFTWGIGDYMSVWFEYEAA